MDASVLPLRFDLAAPAFPDSLLAERHWCYRRHHSFRRSNPYLPYRRDSR
jgi:hypothetical protein